LSISIPEYVSPHNNASLWFPAFLEDNLFKDLGLDPSIVDFHTIEDLLDDDDLAYVPRLTLSDVKLGLKGGMNSQSIPVLQHEYGKAGLFVNKSLAQTVQKLGLSGGSPPKGYVKEEKKEVKKLEKAVKKMEKDKHKSKSQPNPFKGGGGSNTALTIYSKALLDPFDNPMPDLGYGGFQQGVSPQTAYYRLSFVPPGTEFQVFVNPNACCNSSAGAQTTQILSRFLAVGTNDHAVQWSTANTAYASPNCTTLTSMSTSRRVLSAGVRVYVTFPLTAAGGILGAMRLPGCASTAACDTFTNDLVFASPLVKIAAGAGGCASAQVAWCPTDVSDFEFSTSITTNSNAQIQPLIILGTGFPTGACRVFVEVVSNIETLSGSSQIFLSNSNPQTLGGPKMVDKFASPDSLLSKLSGKVKSSSLIDVRSNASSDSVFSSKNIDSAVDWLGSATKFVGAAGTLAGALFGG